ncbi:cytochrome P450/oxidoreductase [Paralcaligenes sp. KSB-10]|uniref:cytochrome P450/oxidoreductase n=1 Tax=Paralcaligenes sp. KSB-10 TaxID=2901142 RepID=UPI001E2A1954|nr:cytochrome P450/oxidoreductase [Paralcaligenes sp. KSB-10]UHL63103.1 cytochrome P450/oxidoreductase [Paralcaligenes sp. KSB-10]
MTNAIHHKLPSACPIAHVAGAVPKPSTGCPISQHAADFDPFQDAYMENPSEFIRWAREKEPVFYSPKLDYWVVTRYQAIKNIFRDPITFSPSNVLEPIEPLSNEAAAILKHYGYAMNRTLVNEDEPAHMARRRVLMAPFTPEHLKQHEPMVRRLVTEAIDQFMDEGHVDLFQKLLWDVPFSVALHFLGIDDDSDREKMHRFSIAHTVNAFGRPTPEERESVAHTVGQFWQLAGEVLEKMKRTPDGPGWMRYSIRQQKDYPDVVTDSYLHSMMMAIIVAAHETTSFASANAIKMLLEHPEAWQDLCADPGLISPAVEECLRHSGSIASWRRKVMSDVEIEGVRIPAGSKLLLVVASANHDNKQFSDPDFFDIRRDNTVEHLTFGFGAHQCLGKNIGRMEMQIIIGELTRRLPHMRLAQQSYKYVHNLSFRGPRNLLVEWDPNLNPERLDSVALQQVQPVRLGAPLAKNMVRKLVVESAEKVAPDTVLLRLASPTGSPLPNWTPGAHLDVECGDTGLSRQYSLCGDLENRETWQIAVQRDPNSRGGSAWIHDYAKPGATLRIRGPRNHFRMSEASTDRIVLIAGGIGITPIMAMAQHAQSLGIDYEIHFSGRSRAALPLIENLQRRHGVRLRLYISEEGHRNNFRELLAQPNATTQIYACGPSRMLDDLQNVLVQQGWPDRALHVEHFINTANRLDPDREMAFEVELRNSGLTLQVPANKTLLEVLRASNIDVQSDCEEGLCGACEVGVVSGEIDHRDSVLSLTEKQKSTRLMACCSRGLSKPLVLDL